MVSGRGRVDPAPAIGHPPPTPIHAACQVPLVEVTARARAAIHAPFDVRKLLRGGARVSGQPVLAELVPETALADAEHARGTRLDLLRLVERAQDHLALQTIERVVEAQARSIILRALVG